MLGGLCIDDEGGASVDDWFAVSDRYAARRQQVINEDERARDHECEQEGDEDKRIAVRGFGVPSSYGLDKSDLSKINTIYSVTLEGMNLCFLGALGNAELPAAAKAELDGIDVLFLPVGGNGVLEHAPAYKLAVQLEPKVIIPMHYDASTLKAFLKEAGAEGTKAEEKLTIKKKDLEGKEAEVVVLSS